MKRLGIVLLAVVVVLAAAWLGLMLNFPGAAASRYVESQVNSHQAFDLVLAPAELRWNRLYVAKAELRRRDNPEAKPLFTVTDFAVPITWRLLWGLPARATLGSKGYVEGFLPWDVGGSGRLDAQVNLSELALPDVLAPVTLTGHADVHVRFTLDAQARAGVHLPDGTLEGSARDVIVSGVHVGDTELPPARLESVDVALDVGRNVSVRRFDFRGDLQGAVEGRITPNLRSPRNSPLSLRITAALRETWLLGLGDLRALVDALSDRGRIVVNLTGTVGRPNLTPVRGGG